MNQSISGAILLFLSSWLHKSNSPSHRGTTWTRISGDVYDGIFEARIAIPPDAIPGDYAFGTGQWEDIWGTIQLLAHRQGQTMVVLQ